MIFSLLVQNQIKNPAIATKFGSEPANVALTNVIVTVWRTAITVGGLALLVMLIIGGLNWITAGGDKGKIEHAKERITQSVIGLLVLVGTVAISAMVGGILGINLLRPVFEDNIKSSTCIPGTTICI